MKRRVSKQSKRRLMIFGILSIVAIGYFFVTIFSYTYNYISLKNEEYTLKNELVALQDEKANLKIEIEKLNDPEYVARYAKENFLYSADGEYVIKIETDDQEQVVSNDNNQMVYVVSISLIVILMLIFIIKISCKPKIKKMTIKTVRK